MTMKNSKTSIKKKPTLLTLIILQSSFILCSAQQANLDSLYTVWQDQNQSDSSRATAYKEYIWNGFLFSNPDSAFILAEELVVFGQKKQYPKARAMGYNTQGTSFAIKGNYPKALWSFERCLIIYEEIGSKKGIAGSLANIGVIYDNQSNYPKALEYYQRSIKIYEDSGDKTGIANALFNIGNIYLHQNNYPKALEHYQRSLKIYQDSGDKQGIAYVLNSIGAIYQGQGNHPRALEYYEKSLKMEEEIGDKRAMSQCLVNIGNIYAVQGNYPRALEYIEKSLKVAEEIGDKGVMAGNLALIGNIHNKQGDYSRALEHLEKSLKLGEEIGDKRAVAVSLTSIGNIYQKQGNATPALNYCQKGLALAEEIGLLEYEKEACQCLYDAYKAMGKGNEALVYLEKMRIVEDSLHAQETTIKLEQMEFAKIMLQDSIAKAEEARLLLEEHQAEVRKKNQTRNISFGIGGLILLLAGGLYIRLRYVRKSKAVLQVEKDRSENLLLNILPADIAAELKEKGKADARDFDMVSILFTDFKGFTEQSVKLSAAELVGEINVCFEAFDGIMAKHGVEKIKTIGDAYMAAGGLPVPTDASVKNTVLAALEMQSFIAKRKAENDAAYKPAFEMRVGIHTGPVVAGIVGVKKFQYDIWGDTVNTASRIESNGNVGKVNISESTFHLLRNDSDFVFEDRGLIEAKGKGVIQMYFVKLSEH
jgi:adenylate cyclase